MRTLDIATPGSRVGLDGSRLTVDRPEKPRVGVAIEDIDLVVLEVPAVAVTGAALAALAKAGIPAMVCDAGHRPVGWLQPVGAREHVIAARAHRQAALPARTRGRLWADIVRAKLGRQAEVLAEAGGHAARLHQLVRTVKPADPSNVEATAARIYWPGLFGADFRRRSEDPRAGALDYGYAVLRAIVCRAVVAAGLHPGVGLHHARAANPFALADDLIEPFRPVVDRIVLRFGPRIPGTAEMKQRMAAVGEEACRSGGESVRCRSAVQTAVDSLARIIDDGRGRLALPDALDDRPSEPHHA
ncbi:MAG: type II CRISPR-associated endonuclease Cas1 [Azospirillum sp.]|nr:type II CRISPR-associated endonuclease Cas1 [Azospirillum sp.]